MKVKYKFLVFFFLLILASSNIIAQQKHFIYIQTDNQQPFYVILNGQNYSSSSIGYIILSKLDNGSYSLRIGFPKNMYPEQKFDVSVDSKDYGYALKNFGDKGWGLFNLQTMDVVMSNNDRDTTSNAVVATQSNKPNRFGEILSDVVNDSTLTKNNAVNDSAASSAATAVQVDAANNKTAGSTVEETNNAGTSATETASVNNKDTEPSSTRVSTDVEEEPDTSAAEASFETKGVIKAEEKNTSKGTDLVFIDFNKSQNDTIHVFIPGDSSQASNEDNATVAGTSANPSSESEVAENTDSSTSGTDNHPATDNVATIDNISSSGQEEEVSKDSTKQVSNPFFSDTANSATANASLTTGDDSATKIVTTKKETVNSTCSNMANEKVIAKLKKKIVFETDANEMIQTVKKGLKGKCISTDDVKELGRLFITDESRYNFFDAVYPYVYDYGSFSSLENQLFDNYYRTRFKAMLR